MCFIGRDKAKLVFSLVVGVCVCVCVLSLLTVCVFLREERNHK